MATTAANRAGQPSRTQPDLTAENARLQAELSRAREEQRAAADVLRLVGARSVGLADILHAIAGHAARLCGADDSGLWRRLGDPGPAGTEAARNWELVARGGELIAPESMDGSDGQTVHINPIGRRKPIETVGAGHPHYRAVTG